MGDPETESPEEVLEMYAANGRRLAKENQALRAHAEELERALTKELTINYHNIGCGYGREHQSSGCIARFMPDAERYVQRVYGAKKEGE